ncbi:hypothetical protein Hanom_Chr00s001470g01682591 [Helianthus anomalus]
MIRSGFIGIFLTIYALQVLFIKLKINSYNVAPHYSTRFTVSKYIGDNVKFISSDYITSSMATDTHVIQDTYEDECAEFLARITTDEWEMGEEALWGPRIPALSSTTTTSVYFFLNIVYRLY